MFKNLKQFQFCLGHISSDWIDKVLADFISFISLNILVHSNLSFVIKCEEHAKSNDSHRILLTQYIFYC